MNYFSFQVRELFFFQERASVFGFEWDLVYLLREHFTSGWGKATLLMRLAGVSKCVNSVQIDAKFLQDIKVCLKPCNGHGNTFLPQLILLAN